MRRVPVAVPLAALATVLLGLPVVGLVWRAPWSSAADVLGDEGVRTALRLSAVASVSATALAAVVGLPLAWVLARRDFPGRRAVRALALVPLVLPPVVGGVALLLAFGRRGLVGQWLDQWFGITLPFTLAGTIVAEAFVAVPFLVLTAEAAFRNLDPRYEEAARTLGAGPTALVWRVVVPLTWPSLAAGLVLAWARALGEFGATITFAGNAPGRTTTVPLEVYLLIESGRFDAAIVVSVLLLAVSVGVLVGLRDRWLFAAVSLDVDIRVVLGTLELDVQLHADAGETVVVVGPNGAGKSTLLRALAGLVTVDGSIVLDGRELVGVLPEERPIGVVFQDHVLFPHLSARDNVAFGVRRRGAARREARATAERWLERVGLADHGALRPVALSGGQSQRVALARALATSPRLLLLDEPLSALDATTRVTTRRELVRHLREHDGIRVVVTHDPLEALALGDRLVVLEDGRVVQQGTAEEIRLRPRSRYVADLVGVNLFRGRATAGVVQLPGGILVAADPLDGDVFAVVHPNAVALHRERPEGTPRNVWPGTVAHLDVEAERVRVTIEGAVALSADITPAAVRALGLAPGATVWASVKATEVAVYAE